MRELQEKLRVVDGPDALSREAQRNATLLFQARVAQSLNLRPLRTLNLQAHPQA